MNKRVHAMSMTLMTLCNVRGGNRTVIVRDHKDTAWRQVTCGLCRMYVRSTTKRGYPDNGNE